MSDIPRGTIFGRRVGHQPISEAEHFIRCPACGREMELALGPIAGTHWLAPIRFSIASTIANLVIEASRFEINVRTEAPFADPKAP